MIDWRTTADSLSDRLCAATARAERAEANLAAAHCELERWRHGVTIEGDFVCPDSLRAEEAEARLAAMMKEAK